MPSECAADMAHAIEKALAELGIVACEGCGGERVVPAEHCMCLMCKDKCPDCNGHGWTIDGAKRQDIDPGLAEAEAHEDAIKLGDGMLGEETP